MQERNYPSFFKLSVCFLWGLLSIRLLFAMTGMPGMQMENFLSPITWILPIIAGFMSAYGYYQVKTNR